MRWSALLFLLPISAWAADADDADLDDLDVEVEEQDQDHVKTLTDSNFAEFIKKNSKVIVEFYAPWCGHCKALEPKFKEAAKILHERKRITKLATVDATVETGIAGEHAVQGYPTLFYYVDGSKSEYNGPRETDGIVEWAEKREKNPLEVWKADEVADKIDLESANYIVLAHVTKKSGRYQAIKKAAMKLSVDEKTSGMTCAVVYLPKTADAKKDATLKFIRVNPIEPDTKEVVYDGVWNEGKLYKWILQNSYDTWGKYEAKKHMPQVLADVGASHTVAFVNGDDSDKKDEVKTALLEIAKKKKEYKLTTCKKGDTGTEALGLESVEEQPMVVILSLEQEDVKKYHLAKPDAASVKKFFKDFENKKLRPFYKSATAPSPALDNGVTVLVGDTFESSALSAKTDVFVEFYAPWCGHCKALTPKYEELAKKVADMGLGDKLVIAKMDATANECAEKISGFPKLILYPATKNSFKKKKEFNGNREVDAMFDFLVENAQNLEGLEISSGEKLDKKSFSMVERERAKKQKEKKKDL